MRVAGASSHTLVMVVLSYCEQVRQDYSSGLLQGSVPTLWLIVSCCSAPLHKKTTSRVFPLRANPYTKPPWLLRKEAFLWKFYFPVR